MRKWSLEEQAMEEFLVGIKQKECIFLTLPGEGMLFEDILESTKGVVTLMKIHGVMCQSTLRRRGVS